MVVTRSQIARRALVKVLLSLASVYAVILSVTRESNDADVLAGYRKLIRKVHPDEGQEGRLPASSTCQGRLGRREARGQAI